MTPDGTLLIGEASRPFQRNQTTQSGALDVHSAASGALLRVEGRWHQYLSKAEQFAGAPGQELVWSNFSGSRLIVETPHGKLSEVGFLTGNRFTPLPQAAQAPLLVAINAGGFQDNGGYVGFAW